MFQNLLRCWDCKLDKVSDTVNLPSLYPRRVLTDNSEEGARFPKFMCSSGVWAGSIPLQKAWDLQDIHDPSMTLKSELERHNLLGSVACSNHPVSGYPLGAHFELHIEQGPRSIGVFRGAQGIGGLTLPSTDGMRIRKRRRFIPERIRCSRQRE